VFVKERYKKEGKKEEEAKKCKANRSDNKQVKPLFKFFKVQGSVFRINYQLHSIQYG